MGVLRTENSAKGAVKATSESGKQRLKISMSLFKMFNYVVRNIYRSLQTSRSSQLFQTVDESVFKWHLKEIVA